MPKHVSNTSSMELSHYATILRRRWIYVASALGVGVLLATALILMVPSKSTSTTSVKINVISANTFSASRPPSDLLDMETEQAMARSTSVMNDVANELGGDWTKAAVRAATEATLLPNGTVLRIQFTGGSPQEAADGATLVAEKYLAYRSDEAQGLVDSAAERLVVRRDSLRKQLANANADVSDAPAGSAARLTADLARQTVADELTTVTTQLNELRVVTTGGGSVITEADPRQTQSSPNRPLMLFSGILGGLLSGLVLAFVVNVLDRRVRDAYDVAGAGGGVTVSRLAGAETRVPAVGVEAEQMRAVRERVMAATSSERPVVAVIDVGPDDAVPTDVAINLAASLADSGLETDLVIVDHPVDVLVNVLHDLSAREVGARAHVRRFRSRAMPTLQISVPDTSGTRLATIDVVVDLVSPRERSSVVTVVALAPSAGSAARLAAGRFADQVLFAAHELGTKIDELAAAASELLAVDASAHGTVLVPEGRHLPAHPSVGEGARLLRSAVPRGASGSAFSGGAVSGARSSALLEVMEDLVSRADDEDPDEVAPAASASVDADPETLPVGTSVESARPEFFDRSVDEDAVDAPLPESEPDAEPTPSLTEETETDEPGPVEPEPVEPGPVEPGPGSEKADAVEDDAVEDDAVEDEVSDADAPGTTAVVATRSKKKRGRARGPVQPRRTPAARPTTASPTVGSPTRTPPPEAPTSTDEDQPAVDGASAAAEDAAPVAPAPDATETTQDGRPEIPANENGWAFTR